MADAAPISEIRAALDPQFNAIIVEGMAWGIYTLIFFQAIWKLHRKAHKGFYSFALMILWISATIKFSCDWVVARSAFVVNNTTPLDIYIALNILSMRILITMDTVALMCVLVSDAILVWRCHVMWHNRYILMVLSTFLCASAGLAITSDTPLHGRLNYLLAFCAQLASLATTASATSLIALKIIRTTRESQMHYSYTRIVQILVESAALVSIVGLGVGSLQLVTYIQPYNMSTSSGRLLYQLLQYLAAVQTPIMGIGPTLIAFRVAEERSQTRDHATSTRTSPLSRLTFRRTAPGGNVDSLTPRTRASTIQFRQAHQSEQMDCVQAYVDIEARSDASGEKAKEIMKQPENISSTESI